MPLLKFRLTTLLEMNYWTATHNVADLWRDIPTAINIHIENQDLKNLNEEIHRYDAVRMPRIKKNRGVGLTSYCL